MPSSSFLRGFGIAFVLAGTAGAAPQDLSVRQAVTPAYTYTLAKQYSGSSFFDGFTFFANSDPTNGFVTYGDRNYAQSNGLIGFDGVYAVMSVDSTTNLGKGQTYYLDHGDSSYAYTNGVGRKSVRIEGSYQFTHGLVIADIAQMPSGICGTWPAFWSFGNVWPNDGEIDIIEGTNLQGGNWMSLHTQYTSNISGSTDVFTAKLNGAWNCEYYNGGNPTGCRLEDQDSATFNNYQGGVWAMQWTSDRIKVWYWPYSAVPADVTAGSPKPGSTTWGTPRSSFGPPQNVNIDQNFVNQHLVFDTTFCGSLGDSSWSTTGCAAKTGYAKCADYVANTPSAFTNAKWKIKYVKIFSEGPVASTSSSTSSSSTRTSSSTSASSTRTSTSISSTKSTTSSTSSRSSASSTSSSSSRSSTSTSTTKSTSSTTSTHSTSSSTVRSSTLTSASKSSSTSMKPTTSTTSARRQFKLHF
ncbi:concanavalin A-like lectin/glucanase domain-containing protein [Xylariales sp. PMI_506]|nr:concanavalin A-like lectin/glucanase domain-containing protein [Xylariales sp. PMI_506]